MKLNTYGSLGYPQLIAYVTKAEPISYLKAEPSYGYANIESRDRSYSSGYGSSRSEPSYGYVSAPVKVIAVEPQGKSWSSGYESSWNGPSYGSSYDNSYSKY